MDERDFARFQFKTDSDRLGFIDTGPCLCLFQTICAVALVPDLFNFVSGDSYSDPAYIIQTIFYC